MFTDEAAILQAAATLAGAADIARATLSSTESNTIRQISALSDISPVQRLINVLRDMQSHGLIPAGFVPDKPASPQAPEE
jgi:hypothetical protein